MDPRASLGGSTRLTAQRGDLTLALVRAADAEPVDGSKLATAAQVVLKEAELLLTDAVLPCVCSTDPR